jgi:hypothetical protein
MADCQYVQAADLAGGKRPEAAGIMPAASGLSATFQNDA